MEPIVANTVAVIKDVSSCLFLGKCKVMEYEHYFYLNDEKIKADKCSSNIYGYTSCTYNGIEYTGVAYESIFVKEYIKNNNINLLNIILPVIGLYILWFILKVLFKVEVRRR